MNEEIVVQLKQDWVQFDDGELKSTIYTEQSIFIYPGYTEEDFEWYMTEYVPDLSVVEDISQFVNCKTGKIFYTYFKPGQPISVLEKLEHTHTLLMLKCTNVVIS